MVRLSLESNEPAENVYVERDANVQERYIEESETIILRCEESGEICWSFECLNDT